jgi:hypothetical protein
MLSVPHDLWDDLRNIGPADAHIGQFTVAHVGEFAPHLRLLSPGQIMAGDQSKHD